MPDYPAPPARPRIDLPRQRANPGALHKRRTCRAKYAIRQRPKPVRTAGRRVEQPTCRAESFVRWIGRMKWRLETGRATRVCQVSFLSLVGEFRVVLPEPE